MVFPKTRFLNLLLFFTCSVFYVYKYCKNEIKIQNSKTFVTKIYIRMYHTYLNIDF